MIEDGLLVYLIILLVALEKWRSYERRWVIDLFCTIEVLLLNL